MFMTGIAIAVVSYKLTSARFPKVEEKATVPPKVLPVLFTDIDFPEAPVKVAVLDAPAIVRTPLLVMLSPAVTAKFPLTVAAPRSIAPESFRVTLFPVVMATVLKLLD